LLGPSSMRRLYQRRQYFVGRADAVDGDVGKDAMSEGALEILKALKKIDAKTDTLLSQTALRCPDGCGRCCKSPEVEATVDEMLPLAENLYDEGEAESWLREAEETQSRVCIFYRQDPVHEWKGRCGVYEHRPAVCRLFGFSARTNKEDGIELIKCHHMDDDLLEKTDEAIRRGEARAPVMATEAARVRALGEHSSMGVLPINEAFESAMKTVLTRKYFESLDSPSAD